MTSSLFGKSSKYSWIQTAQFLEVDIFSPSRFKNSFAGTFLEPFFDQTDTDTDTDTDSEIKDQLLRVDEILNELCSSNGGIGNCRKIEILTVEELLVKYIPPKAVEKKNKN